MRIKLLLFVSLFLAQTLIYAQNLQSPEAFMDHPYGQEFTPHHQLVSYFEHVADNSDHVQLEHYGKTNEHRPLIYAVISSKANLKNLEQIQNDNLIRAGEMEGTPSTSIPIVWLSFGVHGNEAGASESSINTLYQLANKAQPEIQNWLDNVVIIIDPCINPDGFSRYTHWNNGVSDELLNPDPIAREHNEPWPGGRVNHYLFDLNRDWAWLTQIESKQRIDLYQKWVPQIHVDFHEMFHNDPYYFAPAAKPYHDYITSFQGDFQSTIGKNHAKYFDKNGWLYFSKEVFDLFYPSYGDTYPTFNGAIGMTYEQGGHSKAGKGISMENGDTLLLADRIAHHTTTALSTIEVASNNPDELLNNFSSYFKNNAQNPPGKYKSFVISTDNPKLKIARLLKLLDRHKIKYATSKNGGASVTGWDYQNFKEGSYQIKKGDIIISAFQPKSILTQVLFEPNPRLEDSLTYDITAWALPYAYGLKAIASTKKMSGDMAYAFNVNNIEASQDAYAVLFKNDALDAQKLLGAAQQAGLRARVGVKAFKNNGINFPIGTFVLLKSDNKKYQGNWIAKINELNKNISVELTSSPTGWSEKGPDLGSSSFELLDKPKILLVGGEGVAANDFGQCWYWLEQVLNYPVTVIEPEQIGRIELDDYNTLVMPSGWYRVDEKTKGLISDWVRKGNKVIAIESAIRKFAGNDGWGVKKNEAAIDTSEPKQIPFAGSDRRGISGAIPGAIFKVKMDPTHPLAFGFNESYSTLKTTTSSYELLEKGWNVGIIDGTPNHLGFVGSKAKSKLKDSLVFGVKSMGGGSVIYLVDNPVFRAFWAEGGRLLGNAIFMKI